MRKRILPRALCCLLASLALLPLLTGCGGKSDTETSASTAKTGVEGHLNDPNASSSEKEEIRKHMGNGAGSPGSTGTTQ